MSFDPLEVSNEELIVILVRAGRQLLLTGHGTIVKDSGGFNEEHYRYIKSIVLARIGGEKPPFRRGQKVRLVHGLWKNQYFCELGEEVLTIICVFYEGMSRWSVSFDRNKDLYFGTRYDSAQFELVE